MRNLTITLAVFAMAIGLASISNAATLSESFDSFTPGSKIGDHPDWYSDGGTSGPTLTSGQGVAGSVGLSNSGDIFHWTTHPFQWTDANLQAVVVGMDFQTDGSGNLDDDRVGWMIKNDTDGSDFIFGVQADPGGSGAGGNMECYWDANSFGDNGGRTSIADLPALNGNAWFRMEATITKLTDTSAKINASFWSLDAAGNIDTLLANGEIADTSALTGAPMSEYFTGLSAYGNQMWPGYKNHSGKAGYADNATFEVIAVPEPTSIVMAIMGLLGMLACRWRKRA